MNWLKNRRAAMWAALALSALTVAGVGVASYAAPWRTLAKINEAAHQGRSDALRELIDWDSVRDRNTERMAKAEIAKAGLTPGDERINELVLGVHAAVSRVATPDNLTQAAQKGAIDASALKVRGRYMSMGVFVFAVENVKTQNAVSLRLRRMGPMSWRLDDAVLIDPRELGAP
jgi:hypothetical protein